jgi:hypothetical protein
VQKCARPTGLSPPHCQINPKWAQTKVKQIKKTNNLKSKFSNYKEKVNEYLSKILREEFSKIKKKFKSQQKRLMGLIPA